MNIGFVTTEFSPFAKVGGLADVSSGLTKALSTLKNNVTVFLPLYSHLDKRELKIRKYPKWKEVNITIDDKKYTISLFKKKLGKLELLFIYNSEIFKKEGIYINKKGKTHKNIHMRNIFFSKSVLKVIRTLDLKIDILHLNDSHTALIAPYIKTQYYKNPALKDIKTVLTIHNLGSAYQNIHESIEIRHAGLSYDYYYLGGPFEFHGKFNFLKAGIIYSDAVTTVSPSYAEEIKKEKFGEGLEGVLQDKKDKLYGILNGIESDYWNPRTDNFLVSKYSQARPKNKNVNKKELCKRYNLDSKKILLAVISRLTEQKGLELIINNIEKIVKLDLNLVILGTGEKRYEEKLLEIAKKYPDNISVKLEYNEELAHLIEAGGDIFLMPSKYEPCGLNQLYSMRYGTIPIVNNVGGLKDSVIDYSENKEKATGFKLKEFSNESFAETLELAVKINNNQSEWNKLMTNGMISDFSWTNSARKYLEIYENLINQK